MSVIELRETRAAIAQENTVNGGAWRGMGEDDAAGANSGAWPNAISNVTDRPLAQLASVSQLPPKFVPQPENAIRNANAVVPQSGETAADTSHHLGAQPAAPARTVLHTGT